MLFSQIYDSGTPQLTEDQARQMRINRWGVDTVGPRDAFSEDYSDKFNTVLSPDEEEKYQVWATENHREKDVYDYDLRGAWKELQSGTMSEDERGHLGDKYKKPNHPTFSDQSIYSGQDGVAGGVWSRNAEGKDVYTPGRKLSSVEADRLRRYFARNEPGVVLDLKDKVFEERPLPGVNTPLGVFSGLGDTWKGIPAAVLQTASSAITAFKNTGADILSRMGTDETRAWWEGQKAVMDQNARDIREYNKVHFEVDPETMGTASQIVYGLFKTLPKAMGYGLVGGVAGGALAFGADVGIDETNRLMDDGVDRNTAINAGLVSFAMNAIGMRLPAVLGASRGMSAAYGAAANAGTNVAEVEGIKFILEHQDYNQLAQQYDLNGVDLAVSAAMGAAFGGAFWRSPEQIRTQKYQDAARLVYEDQRTALFNKGKSQFNFEQAGTQAAINARAVVSLAKRLGIEPDKVRDFSAKIVWSEDGKAATVPGGEFEQGAQERLDLLNRSRQLDEQIHKWREGDTTKKFDLGTPSWVLQLFGVQTDSNVKIFGKSFLHAILKPGESLRHQNGKHGLTDDEVRGILVGIQRPIAVFRSTNIGAKPGEESIVLLTEQTQNGKNVVAPLWLTSDVNGTIVVDNQIPTAFAKSNIKQWVDDGLLLGYEKEKGLNLLLESMDSNRQQLGTSNRGEPLIDGAIVYQNDTSVGDLYQIIGETGVRGMDAWDENWTRTNLLTVAKQMEMGGKTPKEIRAATGWERGADREWRYEIPDLTVKDGAATLVAEKRAAAQKDGKKLFSVELADLVDAPDLFKAFGRLRDLKIEFGELPPMAGGYFAPEENAIRLPFAMDITTDGARMTLIHEIQHAIQEAEGFTKGADFSRVPTKGKVLWRAMGELWRLRNNPDWQEYKDVNDALNRIYDEEATQARREKGITQAEDDAEVDRLFQQVEALEKRPAVQAVLAEEKRLMKIYGSSEFDGVVLEAIKNASESPDDPLYESVSRWNPDFQMNAYRRVGGEVEARNAGWRAFMSPEDRAKKLLRDTEDVPRSEQTRNGEFYQTTGAFSYDASSQPTDRLVAVHHIDADNLLKANALGGLAVPSIGITKVNSGYSGFGDITLIGTKGLIDPATGTPVYSADAYTNTFPEFQWGKSVDKAKAEALRREYRKTEQSFRGGMDNTMRSLIDSPDRDDFMWRFRNSVVSQKMFLDEKGIKVEPVYQQPYAGTPLEHLLLPLFKKIDADRSLDAAGEIQAYNEAYVQAVDALGDKATRVQKRNADKIRNGGRLVDAYLYTLINNVEKIGKAPTEPQIDSYATEKRIREAFENNSEGFDAWVAKKTNGLFGEPKIKVGGKLVPVTLQNVVKAMTKRVVKNTQNTMTFGPGKVRAAASKKFPSVESIQANRERVVDPATADAANKSIDAAMSDFRKQAADFYGYKDTFAAMDDAMRALADSAKGKPTTEKVRVALVKNGFKEPKGGFPSELLDSGVKILTDVQKGLTDYFEAKPQRAVGLSEFAGAVVPEGTSPEVLKVLENSGVEVRTYAKDTVLPGGERTNNRLQAEKELSQKLQQDRGDVLFQNGRGEGEIRGSFNPQTNTIKLTPNANLSTFSHEHSHWYLTNLFAHAADENLSPEARADIDALLKAFGLKSVAEYNALPFEQKVKLQERYAAWTERYLSEGKVPAGYLQGMFRRFAQWLMDMYRDLLGEGAGDDAAKKEIGERYKAQFGEELPELSPEVRRVLNRMYDAENKMASFRSKSGQVTAARVIQAQRTNNQKVTAPLQDGTNPDAFSAAVRAQQQAAQAMNSGEQVDVSQTMKNVPANDAAIQQAQNAFAKSFQMGDTGTIVVLQNRDRTGAVSVGQMNAIATAPDYTRLSVSRTTDSGAPIVSYGTVPDSQYLGNTETVADGSHKIPMTYAVVEADSVLRSNNFDGTPVPEYGTDPSRMHAIAGNGRMAGLSEAYNRGTAEQYRQDLMADAQSVGINSEVVAGMQRPVLVRIMPPEAVETGFIERSNSSNVLEKSALETAVQDSPRIRDNVWKYQFDEDGAPTPETVRQFTIDIGEPNSLGKLLTADSRPTETATNRLRAAVFYEAYRDRTLTALVADDTDKQGIKRILNAMAAFAPHVINIREASNGAVDLGPILVDVVNRIRNAKIEGTPLESIIGQGDVFGDNPAVQQLLGFIAENQNSAAAIARVLEPFAAAVENRLKSSGNGPQGGLFGEAENVSTDLADVMGIFRDTQNRLISEANAAMRESGATEGFRDALPAVDVETMRNTLQALAEAQRPAEEVVESVVETVAEKTSPEAAPEASAQTTDVETQQQAYQAHEQSVFSENADRVQVESLAEINPDMVYEWQDDDGNAIRRTARYVLETDAAIDAEANKDMAAMGTAAMCIYRNNGITE